MHHALSGPPTVRGDLDISRHVGMPGVKNIPAPRKLPSRIPTWRFATVSTRLFMIDMERFAKRIGSLELLRPDVKRRIRSLAYNQQPVSMPAEEVLSTNMMRSGVHRLDFLGTGTGMYSLHPPYRSPEFYAALASIVERIERAIFPKVSSAISISTDRWWTGEARSRPRRVPNAMRKHCAISSLPMSGVLPRLEDVAPVPVRRRAVTLIVGDELAPAFRAQPANIDIPGQRLFPQSVIAGGHAEIAVMAKAHMVLAIKRVYEKGL